MAKMLARAGVLEPLRNDTMEAQVSLCVYIHLMLSNQLVLCKKIE